MYTTFDNITSYPRLKSRTKRVPLFNEPWSPRKYPFPHIKAVSLVVGYQHRK